MENKGLIMRKVRKKMLTREGTLMGKEKVILRRRVGIPIKGRCYKLSTLTHVLLSEECLRLAGIA